MIIVKKKQIQSTNNEKQVFLELIRDDPEYLDILDHVDFYINKIKALGLSKKHDDYSFYEVCTSVYLRFSNVDSRSRFLYFKNALGGVFRSMLSSTEKLRRLAEFDTVFSSDFSNLEKK